MDEVSGSRQAGPVATREADVAGLLPQVGGLLLASLSTEATHANVAGAVVGFLADWCTLTAAGDGGTLQRVAVACCDPASEEAARRLLSQVPAGTGPESEVREVISTGRGKLDEEVSEGEVAAVAEDQRSLLHHLGFRSRMTIPLVSRGRALGALTLMRGDYRGRYAQTDLHLAEEIASLGAAAIDNARLHGDLQAREARLRSLLDSLGAIAWEADPSTLSFSFVSRRAEELLGYPVQRWLDDAGFWPSRIHPGDRDYTVSYRRVATAEGRDHELEYRMVAADGRKLWFQDIVCVEVGDDGRPLRLVGFMVDITRRKRTEAILLESRQRFASLARTLQASLLPPHLPEIQGLEVAARYRSAEDGVEVVGDFYDLFDTGDGGWGVVMGDVCGKGPDAAALAAVARHTVRAAAMRERRPSRVLERLNEAVLGDDSDERFCTAVYARVVPGPENVGVVLSCGGHPLPLVLRADGTIETAGRPGSLLGLFDEPDLEDVDLQLRRGDAAVFFTDGATEAKRRGMLLGEDRLQALVGACGGLRAEEIAGRMVDAILTFQEGAPQDDLAIVVLRVP